MQRRHASTCLGKLTRLHTQPQPQRIEPSSPRFSNRQWRSCACASQDHQHGPGTRRSRCTALMVDGVLGGNLSFATMRFPSTRGTRRTTSRRSSSRTWCSSASQMASPHQLFAGIKSSIPSGLSKVRKVLLLFIYFYLQVLFKEFRKC